MAWIAPDVDRSPQPARGDEREALEGWLDFHRDTLLHKCAGLTAEQLVTRSAEPSALTLLGIVRHATELELWLAGLRRGEESEDVYSSEEDPDGAFRVSADDAEADLARYREAVAASRSAPWRDLSEEYEEWGEKSDFRYPHLHVLEEYARHNGHADLLRERIDGATGT